MAISCVHKQALSTLYRLKMENLANFFLILRPLTMMKYAM